MPERTCVTDGCDRPHYGRGWCKRHYQQAYTAGRLTERPREMVAQGATLEERLRHTGWDVDDRGCWLWRGSLNARGYGQVAIGRARPGIASRVAYEAWVGPIPAEGAVCHSCDVPRCINPAHLFLGTRAVNNADMRAKHRHAHGERHPDHRLTDAQVAEIRARYAAGGVLQRQLAEEFGVSRTTVTLIVGQKRRVSAVYAA